MIYDCHHEDSKERRAGLDLAHISEKNLEKAATQGCSLLHSEKAATQPSRQLWEPAPALLSAAKKQSTVLIRRMRTFSTVQMQRPPRGLRGQRVVAAELNARKAAKNGCG